MEDRMKIEIDRTNLFLRLLFMAYFGMAMGLLAIYLTIL